MKRYYSVFNIVKLQKHAEMQKHFQLLKVAFHFFYCGTFFFQIRNYFFIINELLPGNAFRHNRDFFRLRAYTIYNNTNIRIKVWNN